MRYSLALCVLACLTIPARAQTNAGPASRPAVVTVAALPWTAMPAWQKAPDGNGEYMLMPSPQRRFDIDGREFAATSMGMLVRDRGQEDSPGAWRIVPELYGRNLQPLEVKAGLLWAVEGRSRRTPAAPVRVLGLDVKDWSVRRDVRLPADAVPVGVDEAGVWFVQPGPPVPTISDRARRGGGGRGPSPQRYGAIALCDFAGKEVFRYRTQESPATGPAVVSPAEARKTPQPRICWWGIDPDAVWLGIVDFRGVTPDDGEIYGPTRFLRIDRATGRQVTVDAPGWSAWLTVNTADRILWLEREGFRGNQFYRVHALDKNAARIVVAGRVDAENVSEVAIDAGRLWVRQRVGETKRVRAFSLKDFSEVAAKGPMPALPSTFAWWEPTAMFLLGGDDARLWLSVDRQIVELPDEGGPGIRSMPTQVMDSRYLGQIITRPGVLYAAAGLQLFRVVSGSDQVLVRREASRFGYGLLLLSGEGLWATVGDEWRVFTHDLVHERNVTVPSGMSPWGVMGQTYFCFATHPTDGLFRMGPGDKGPVRVESWDKVLAAWTQRAVRPDGPGGEAHRPMLPPDAGADGSGRLSFVRRSPTAPRVGGGCLLLWTYDVATDRWQGQALDPNLVQTTIDAGPGRTVLFDQRREWDAKDPLAFRVLFQGRLSPLGPLPPGWVGQFDWQLWRIHATARHQYAWTPLGLWRTTRERKSATAPAE